MSGIRPVHTPVLKDPLLDSGIERCYTYDYGEDETEQTNCSGDAKADEFRWIRPNWS